MASRAAGLRATHDTPTMPGRRGRYLPTGCLRVGQGVLHLFLGMPRPCSHPDPRYDRCCVVSTHRVARRPPTIGRTRIQAGTFDVDGILTSPSDAVGGTRLAPRSAVRRWRLPVGRTGEPRSSARTRTWREDETPATPLDGTRRQRLPAGRTGEPSRRFRAAAWRRFRGRQPGGHRLPSRTGPSLGPEPQIPEQRLVFPVQAP